MRFPTLVKEPRCRVTGNHLAAQNDEPEPDTIFDQARAALALADQIRARRTPDYLKTWPTIFVGPPAPIVVNTPTVAEYRAALASHDWHFQHADDHGAYCRGRDSLARLVRLQELLDPAFKLWNEFAPVAVDVDGMRKAALL